MKTLLHRAALLLLLATPALAHDGVEVTDPFARVLVGNGAVYFTINNHATTDDVLLSASSPIAGMVHLMNSSANANGVMSMEMVHDGFAIPAGTSRTLKGGGDHVMLMDLTAKPTQGETFTLILTFAQAGEVTLTVPVDNTRKTDPGAGPTNFDASATVGDHAAAPADHSAHAAHSSPAISIPAGPDEEMIVATMKAMFDKPDNPLTVDPVVVSGDSAIASWAQGDMGGRALLARHHGQWQIVLCGGPDLRSPAFLAANGVGDAAALSHMFNMAEDKLGADAVSRYSSFEGVVMISEPAHN